jgi:prophage regulatory protein
MADQSYKNSRILRCPQVMERTGLAKSTIYLHMQQGTFPKQISIGPRAIGWLETEIDSWLKSHVEERDSMLEATRC